MLPVLSLYILRIFSDLGNHFIEKRFRSVLIRINHRDSSRIDRVPAAVIDGHQLLQVLWLRMIGFCRFRPIDSIKSIARISIQNLLRFPLGRRGQKKIRIEGVPGLTAIRRLTLRLQCQILSAAPFFRFLLRHLRRHRKIHRSLSHLIGIHAAVDRIIDVFRGAPDHSGKISGVFPVIRFGLLHPALCIRRRLRL